MPPKRARGLSHLKISQEELAQALDSLAKGELDFDAWRQEKQDRHDAILSGRLVDDSPWGQRMMPKAMKTRMDSWWKPPKRPRKKTDGRASGSSSSISLLENSLSRDGAVLPNGGSDSATHEPAPLALNAGEADSPAATGDGRPKIAQKRLRRQNSVELYASRCKIYNNAVERGYDVSGVRPPPILNPHHPGFYLVDSPFDPWEAALQRAENRRNGTKHRTLATQFEPMHNMDVQRLFKPKSNEDMDGTR